MDILLLNPVSSRSTRSRLRLGRAVRCLLCPAVTFAGALLHGTETRHFIIGNIGGSAVDSGGFYVAPISDPEQIAQAHKAAEVYRTGGFDEVYRQWIDEGLAWRISALCDGETADGINRDYSRPGAPNWNWHVEVVQKIFNAEYVLIGGNGNPWAMELGRAGSYHLDTGLLGINFGSYGPIGELPFPYDAQDAFGPKTSWIGTFGDEHYPWIAHDRLGWLWVSGFDPENVWVWSHQRSSWVYFAESIFPWFWDQEEATWRYWITEESQNWFFQALDGSWSERF